MGILRYLYLGCNTVTLYKCHCFSFKSTELKYAFAKRIGTITYRFTGE